MKAGSGLVGNQSSAWLICSKMMGPAVPWAVIGDWDRDCEATGLSRYEGSNAIGRKLQLAIPSTEASLDAALRESMTLSTE